MLTIYIILGFYSVQKRMQWREEKHHGDWIRGLTAGGCGNPPDQG